MRNPVARRLWRCVVAALTVSGCGGQPGTPTSPAATGVLAARVAVTIDSLGSAAAVAGVSDVRFDASATTGPGALQYLVDYGDNTQSKEAVSQHTYGSPGTYEARVIVTDLSGHNAVVSKSVTVRSFEGSWFQAGLNPDTGRFELRRLVIASQSGRSVSGTFAGQAGGPPVTLSGTIDGERGISLRIAGQPGVTGTIPSQVFAQDAAFSLAGFSDTGGRALPFQPIIGEAASAPPIARLDIRIDSAGSPAAIMGLSPVRYTATGSQADTPVYFIEFGDGQFAAEGVAVHPCETKGLLTSRLTVVDRFGRFSSTTSQLSCVSLVHSGGVTYSLTYGWQNYIQNNAAHRAEVRQLGFEAHRGTLVSGYYTHPEGNRSHFTGTLSGERTIAITLDDGTITFTGDVILKDAGLGFVTNRHIIVRTRGGSADGMTLDFQFYDPF